MFVSKKDHENLKEIVKKQDEDIVQLFRIATGLENELNELKRPKEPTYFK